MKRILKSILTFAIIGLFAITSNTVYADTKVPPTAKKKAKYFKVNLDLERTIGLFGPVTYKITDLLISELLVLDAMDNKRPIVLVLNTPGGYVGAGNNLIMAIDSLQAPVICIVQDGAYSMGAAIASHCPSLYMTKYSDLMFHMARYRVGGYEHHIESRVKHFANMSKIFHGELAQLLGMKYDVYLAKIKDELWLTAEQAFENGVAEGILPTFFYSPPDIFKSDMYGFLNCIDPRCDTDMIYITR